MLGCPRRRGGRRLPEAPAAVGMAADLEPAMCGICGVVGRADAAPVDEALLGRMCALLRHRGPDGEGVFVAGPVGFGHRRLSVIDLDTGDQPIYNEDRSVVVVLNGEIYNFRALRRDLESRGHRFRTKSDTEVIVHLYEEDGVRCLERLDGMFAFALWDATRRCLFAAVDRAGKKPLYYAEHAGGLRFASELKALLADPAFPRDLNPAALDDYLAYQYIPAPRTIWRAARKLPPAHAMTWAEGRLTLWRYWRLPYEPKLRIGPAAALDAVHERVSEAVRVRLESDVPLGVFLSGGVDSSLVVAMMRKWVGGPLKTFSIGFRQETFDERPYARRVADRFETEHQEFVLDPDALDVLPRLVWHFDEPMADSSALPTWFLSELTSRHVTVALNGDGGDESFAGYRRYLGLEYYGSYRLFRRAPAVFRRWAARALSGGSRLAPGNMALVEWAGLAKCSLDDAAHQYVLLVNTLPEYARRWLYTDDLARRVADHPSAALVTTPYTDGVATEEVDRRMHTDVETYLPGDLLVKVDRATMAFGLEGRSPLLDRALMEYAARLPAEVKFPGRELKGLLKQVAAREMPRSWLDRPKKGFSIPVSSWFRRDFRPWARDLLTSRRSLDRGFFQPRRLDRILARHERGRASLARGIWALVILELWCRTFLDRTDILDGPITL